MKNAILAWAATGLLAACAGLPPELSQALGGVSAAPGSLSEADIAAGLKDALDTGTRRAVARVGVPDGFNLNPAIAIPLPDQLARAERTLRALGQGRTVDEFRLSLNRAAEAAVPQAAPVFTAAIRSMTLSDARAILDGPPTAATDYFRGKTWDALSQRFAPIVARATSDVGATRKYKDLAGKVAGLVPGYKLQDIDQYVTERALAGLFHELGAEEMRIRDDPAARTSELLQKVFGAR